MVTRQTAKSKGSQFEMDCEASLQQKYPDAYRTHERGYITQYDIVTNTAKLAFECKRLKGITWNECKKYLKKLTGTVPDGFQPILLFKSNNQPCLAMTRTVHGLTIMTFESLFNIPFIKHKPTRRVKQNDMDKHVAGTTPVQQDQ